VPAGSGAFQAAIQHDIADADVLRRHHVDAQHAGEVLPLQLAAGGAVHDVMGGGQARQDGSGQAGPGLVGNAGGGAELLGSE